jgi:tetratricopeptide (TPR) repeat protein
MLYLERRNFKSFFLSILAIGILPLLNMLAFENAPSPFPTPGKMSIGADFAVEMAGFLTLGMHRMAADMGFVDVLMYYGDGDIKPPEEQFRAEHYMKMKDRVINVLNLDPYFTYAILYGSGILAFNLNRPQEAIEVLNAASVYQPKNWKYRAYTIAIGLKVKGDISGVLNQLMPVVEDPDCPTQLKNMLAFVNFKLGRRDEAIRLFKEILKSRDPNYAHLAVNMLRRMGVAVDE